MVVFHLGWVSSEQVVVNNQKLCLTANLIVKQHGEFGASQTIDMCSSLLWQDALLQAGIVSPFVGLKAAITLSGLCKCIRFIVNALGGSPRTTT